MGVSRFKLQSSRARCILCVEVEDLCSNLVPLVLLTSHDRATSARRSVAHARGAAHDTSAAAQGVERCAARAHLLQGPALLDHVMHRAPRPLNHQLPLQGSSSAVVGRVGGWGGEKTGGKYTWLVFGTLPRRRRVRSVRLPTACPHTKTTTTQDLECRAAGGARLQDRSVARAGVAQHASFADVFTSFAGWHGRQLS